MPDWDDIDEGDGQDGEEKNKSFKDLRNYSKKLERESKAMASELEELKAFRTQITEERRDAALGATFKEVGLSESHAKLFKALNPEIEAEAITPESVFNFAKEYELVSADTAAPEAAPEKKEGFTPVVVGQPAPLTQYTTEEVQKLLREGKTDEVTRAYKEGRVVKESVPWTRQA